MLCFIFFVGIDVPRILKDRFHLMKPLASGPPIASPLKRMEWLHSWKNENNSLVANMTDSPKEKPQQWSYSCWHWFKKKKKHVVRGPKEGIPFVWHARTLACGTLSNKTRQMAHLEKKKRTDTHCTDSNSKAYAAPMTPKKPNHKFWIEMVYLGQQRWCRRKYKCELQLKIDWLKTQQRRIVNWTFFIFCNVIYMINFAKQSSFHVVTQKPLFKKLKSIH